MNFAYSNSSKINFPSQELPVGKEPTHAPNRMRISRVRDSFPTPPLGKLKSKNSQIEGSLEDYKKFESPIDSYSNQEDQYNNKKLTNRQVNQAYSINPKKKMGDMVEKEKSQSSKPVRAKLNLGANVRKPGNIFADDTKARVFKDIEKKKMEVENLIIDQNENKNNRQLNTKARVRILKQNSQEKKQDSDELSPDNSQLDHNEIANRHYDYVERQDGQESSVEEVASPETKGRIGTTGNKRVQEEEEEKGFNQGNYDGQYGVPIYEQSNALKIKKGTFIINTRASVTIEKMPKQGDNERKVKGTTPRIIKLKTMKSTEWDEKEVGKTPMDRRDNFKEPLQMTKQQRSNVYTQLEKNSANMKESLYSEEEMKKISLAHKLKGNDYFKAGNQNKAIEEYSKAIKLYAKDSTYFSNRAVCYKMLLMWDKVIVDCEMSILLNNGNFKAFNLKGHALVELGKKERGNRKISDGIKSLEKAIQLHGDQGSVGDTGIKKELEVKINKARKILWLKEHKAKENKKDEISDYVNRLINEDNKLKQSLYFDPKETFDIFKKEKESKETKEIPEYLCCKITFDLMKEPIMTPYGIGYEKTVIYEHLKKNGNFDPVTRRPLPTQFLAQNKSLERAIEGFVKQNPWSYDFVSFDEDYQKIAL